TEKDAYEVLVVDDIDELAEEKYLRALRSGDKSAKYEGDRLRKLRAETIAKTERAIQEATRARRAYEKLLKEYSLEIAKLAARRRRWWRRRQRFGKLIASTSRPWRAWRTPCTGRAW